ncbi:MAG: acetolactate synthase [Verrucomicrobia bacterium GWC2_42_7]|nr:MAG: acetolactate synthase [Verrucomicrobia bacterium GWC2_42_7]
MKHQTMKKPGKDSIIQFSIYAANRVGRLNDLVGLLNSKDIHIMAICSLDTTDSAIIRLIVDYPEQARDILEQNHFPFNEVEVVGVELDNEEQLKSVTCALVQAEINIHYIYPFIMRPRGKSGIVINLEDNDLASEVLKRNQIRVIRQSDIAR